MYLSLNIYPFIFSTYQFIFLLHTVSIFLFFTYVKIIFSYFSTYLFLVTGSCHRTLRPACTRSSSASSGTTIPCLSSTTRRWYAAVASARSARSCRQWRYSFRRHNNCRLTFSELLLSYLLTSPPVPSQCVCQFTLHLALHYAGSTERATSSDKS